MTDDADPGATPAGKETFPVITITDHVPDPGADPGGEGRDLEPIIAGILTNILGSVLLAQAVAWQLRTAILNAGYVVVPRTPTRTMLGAAWADALGEDAAAVWAAMIEAAASTGDPETFPVICLCGSSRFQDQHEAAAIALTLAGRLVLGMHVYGHRMGIDMDGPVKAMLDRLHRKRIDLADEVFVINVGGYVGDSTRREIAYARAAGKPVRYLEPPGRDDGFPEED
jgi:hypothetical protein